jgi:hypothetical protein
VLISTEFLAKLQQSILDRIRRSAISFPTSFRPSRRSLWSFFPHWQNRPIATATSCRASIARMRSLRCRSGHHMRKASDEEASVCFDIELIAKAFELLTTNCDQVQ